MYSWLFTLPPSLDAKFGLNGCELEYLPFTTTDHYYVLTQTKFPRPLMILRATGCKHSLQPSGKITNHNFSFGEAYSSLNGVH